MITKEEIKEVEKYRTFITNNTVLCKCGHSVFLPKTKPVKICSHCKQYVYRDEREKFKFLIKPKSVDEG